MKITNTIKKILLGGAIAIIPLGVFANNGVGNGIPLGRLGNSNTLENGFGKPDDPIGDNNGNPQGNGLGVDGNEGQGKGNNPNPVNVPLDGGLSLLIGSGVALGLKRARDKRRAALQK